MFIVLEGVDGVGKSTQARLLAEALRSRGRPVAQMSFPVRTNTTGKIIDAWLKGIIAPPMAPAGGFEDAEALTLQSLMHANRLEHLSELRKAMGEGDLIVDRYWPSGYAYGVADGLEGKWVVTTSALFPKPQLHILLDIDIEQAEHRRAKRTGVDTYELKALEHKQRVISNYRELWRWHVGETSWCVVSARGAVGDTAARILEAVDEVKKNHAPLF